MIVLVIDFIPAIFFSMPDFYKMLES